MKFLLSTLVSPVNTLLAMITDFFGTEPEIENIAERAFKKMRTNDATAKKKRDRSSVNGIPNNQARSFITRIGD